MLFINSEGFRERSGSLLECLTRAEGPGFEPHRRHWVVLSKNIIPSVVLVQPRKTCPFIFERLLMGRKESKTYLLKSNKRINCKGKLFCESLYLLRSRIV